MNHYDSVIIGAGHNGLVCAAYLARAGQRVLVLEAGDAPGGLAAKTEFHPGFHASVAHTTSHLSQKVVSELDLESYGFDPGVRPLPTIGLSADREHVTLLNGVVSGTTPKDADAYQQYARLMRRFANSLSPFWLKTIPRIGSGNLADLTTFGHIGLNIRRLGRKDMREFLRIASLPARDLMDEYFDNEILKALLSWDGLIGSKMAPRSPNSAVLAMLYRMGGKSSGAHSILSGGANGLIDALCLSAKAAGTDIRNSSPVQKILVDGSADGLRTKGVRLSSGEEITADRVVSAADPQRTFLDLLGVRYLDIGFTNRIRRLRCHGYVAKLHLALNDRPEFQGLEGGGGRMIIAPNMDAIEFAFDDAKYGDCPSSTVMEVVVPSVYDATLAPTGQHVLSAHVMYVPYKLNGGWTDEARDQMCERTIDTLSRYAPQIREQIIHKKFLTPADLEQSFQVTGGHWHHTEFAMDQMLMMRPTYRAAQYSSPVPGLFLCGAGCHPGGDITGAAGHNAAHEILR